MLILDNKYLYDLSDYGTLKTAEIFEVIFYHLKTNEHNDNLLDEEEYSNWLFNILYLNVSFKGDRYGYYNYLTYLFKDNSLITIRDPNQIFSFPKIKTIKNFCSDFENTNFVF